jgi:membrane fusion protein (multidrug efflux system)
MTTAATRAATALRLAAGALACALGGGLWAGGATAQQAPAAIPVGVVTIAEAAVSGAVDLVGRVEAIDRVEVRARVTGFLEEVAFREGQTVEEGQLLYRIEADEFEAAVRQAEGALAQAQAAKALGDIQLRRAQELLDKASGTVVARDQAAAEAARAAGEVASREAQLATATINLGYTAIHAPVAGKIGRTALTKGAVVGPDSGPLALIVSQDPVHVTFPFSARALLTREAADAPTDISTIRVSILLPGGEVYEHESALDFVDVAVDQTTDTVLARATFPNPPGRLVDGMLVSVQVRQGEPVEKPVVPQAALIADQGGVYVLAVADGKAAVRRVRTGQAVGGAITVEEGLAPGDLVIVEGLERVRPGAAVVANPVEVPGTN